MFGIPAMTKFQLPFALPPPPQIEQVDNIYTLDVYVGCLALVLIPLAILDFKSRNELKKEHDDKRSHLLLLKAQSSVLNVWFDILFVHYLYARISECKPEFYSALAWLIFSSVVNMCYINALFRSSSVVICVISTPCFVGWKGWDLTREDRWWNGSRKILRS